MFDKVGRAILAPLSIRSTYFSNMSIRCLHIGGDGGERATPRKEGRRGEETLPVKCPFFWGSPFYPNIFRIEQ